MYLNRLTQSSILVIFLCIIPAQTINETTTRAKSHDLSGTESQHNNSSVISFDQHYLILPIVLFIIVCGLISVVVYANRKRIIRNRRRKKKMQKRFRVQYQRNADTLNYVLQTMPEFCPARDMSDDYLTPVDIDGTSEYNQPETSEDDGYLNPMDESVSERADDRRNNQLWSSVSWHEFTSAFHCSNNDVRIMVRPDPDIHRSNGTLEDDDYLTPVRHSVSESFDHRRLLCNDSSWSSLCGHKCSATSYYPNNDDRNMDRPDSDTLSSTGTSVDDEFFNAVRESARADVDNRRLLCNSLPCSLLNTLSSLSNNEARNIIRPGRRSLSLIPTDVRFNTLEI